MALPESKPTFDEDRIMRVWTPRILRTILIASTIILIAGMVAIATRAPGYYVERFRAVQDGTAVLLKENWLQTAAAAAHGNPHAIMTLGLVVLTLVPLARVAFTFVIFLREGDRVFVAATAYVLTGLIVGVVLGRVG